MNIQHTFLHITEREQRFADEILARLEDDRFEYDKGYGKAESMTYVYYIRDHIQIVELCFCGYKMENGSLVVERILEKHWGPNPEPMEIGKWIWFGDNERDQTELDLMVGN